VFQASLRHLASQLIGVLTNGLVRRELVLVRSIGLDLLSNVFVELSEPLVRHSLDAHDQLLNATTPETRFPIFRIML
jgi:hypothetical protein